MTDRIDLEALVREHPLPWHFELSANPDSDAEFMHDAYGNLVPHDWYALALAAPAMALAIRALLTAYERNTSLADYLMLRPHVDALRAALPEALRT